ncbi:MAG: hypothetical protein C4527_18845 [Candidatus Omnitrophota bacterium]|jgi:predicted transcriptional regulator|nr:MAG: hypothetical protein C4527_18845 [Candidatus Omnitrophota bacterium]
MSKVSNELTPAEIWLLNVLYELSEADIYSVLDRISHEREWKYTTVQTMIHHMCDKGYIVREKIGRRFMYKPTKPRSKMFETVLNKLFGLSLKHNPVPLVDYLMNIKKLNARDEQILRALLVEEE